MSTDFVTKEDLKNELKEFKKEFKEELIEDFKKIFATKEDLQTMKKDILDGVAEYLESRIITILNGHEVRIDRLEKHAGGFPPVS